MKCVLPASFHARQKSTILTPHGEVASKPWQMAPRRAPDWFYLPAKRFESCSKLEPMERSPVVQNYVEIQKREGARNRIKKSVPDCSLESLCEGHSYNLPVFLPEGRQLEWDR